MADRRFTEFQSTLQKSQEILKELEHEMGWHDRESQAYAGLREVLHALRDRMMPMEALDFAAQLPMLLAGVFVHGWKPADTPADWDAEQFYERIQENLPYTIDGGTRALTRAVWRVLQRHVSQGELDDVLANLPEDLVASITSE